MNNVLTRKLERLAPLSLDDRLLLDDVVRPSRTFPEHTDLIRAGRPTDAVRLIVDGLACGYKSLENGKRQIVTYLIPGDFCDLNVILLNGIDHSVATMSVCTVVDIPRHRVIELTRRPDIARALWWVTLVDEATSREWLLNIGQRPAVARLAHLFCELHARMKAAGLATGNSYGLPLIQSDIADSVGLSLVHVNRCLQQLRDMQVVTFRNRVITIDDLDKLTKLSGFDPHYLHLGGD